jgi:hypothetical protein
MGSPWELSVVRHNKKPPGKIKTLKTISLLPFI